MGLAAAGSINPGANQIAWPESNRLAPATANKVQPQVVRYYAYTARGARLRELCGT